MQADPFADLNIPPVLQDSLDRHRLQLAQLVQNLRSAGVDEVHIEVSVSTLVDSYRTELLRAIKAVMR
ncbi:hypothetical protein [Terriglobus aquaticus]|uniref:Uncharacterized protein n=1 Tax=Terriglobus aquaticus TaxID=940139 RepID=A0ABW9KIJ0_9BACT|nr:hypothetical protein [Terriglobus aquaticus]